MSVLHLEKLNKIYKPNTVALNSVSFSIKLQSITGIVGPNGSGKTTLLNCIIRTIKQTSGEIEWDEVLDNDFLYIPDENILPELLTGKEYLCFLGKLYNKKIDDKNIAELSTIFSIEKELNNTISTYSYGMKKKIQIIASCLIKPGLLILDEPFRGLDVESIIITKELLKGLQYSGSSIFLSSHDISSIEQLCSEVIMIKLGNIVCNGSIQHILDSNNADCLEEVFVKLFKNENIENAQKYFN
ncbi:MAG: ABC transporter ATP-binding protein [Bifidobacteriaceae bacterium]|jgi:ABC-2 type transport system ATP-binding protein|nr:ABC transporter ATP-binding protein [Bifidobacteriaceae bacterium]